MNILLVYGEGGHRDQAMRLMGQMRLLDTKLHFIHITDADRGSQEGTSYCVKPMREKNSRFNPFSFLIAYLKAAALTARLIFVYKPRAVIGFGPGICIPVFMACAILNVRKRIFFEDWCRFTSKSLSGKACYPFSTMFFIQNESLKDLYKNAKFAGRL